jgi:hypothetical protein
MTFYVHEFRSTNHVIENDVGTILIFVFRYRIENDVGTILKKERKMKSAWNAYTYIEPRNVCRA